MISHLVIIINSLSLLSTSLSSRTGMKFGMSTMAAAALGNTISDLLGIGSAWYVESLADKLGEGSVYRCWLVLIIDILTTFLFYLIHAAMPGARPPDLSPEQLEMRSSRIFANLGRALGVFVGCLLGNMLTLPGYLLLFIFRNVSTSLY